MSNEKKESMAKKMFYVEIGSDKHNARQIPVFCEESQLCVIATAIGNGAKSPSCVAYDKPNQTCQDKPYAVYWDCM